MEDKRIKKRVRVNLPALCDVYGYPQVSFNTIILDASPQGMAFETVHELVKGQEMEIQIEWDKRKIFFKAHVMNCETSKITKISKIGVTVLTHSPQEQKEYFQFYEELLRRDSQK